MRASIRWTAVAAVLAVAGADPVTAQQVGNVTGTVLEAETNRPLEGAQVQIVGTTLGQLANAEGRYLIQNVPAGQVTVRVQLLGFGSAQQAATVTAGGTITVNFTLSEQAIPLDEIVVTALGIERQERGLGYAVQSVSADRLAEIPEINVVAALKGQTAGVDINTATSRPGGSSRIVIRGESSFTGGGQPLWVIDGVPISMDTDAHGGFTGREAFELESGQAGNRGMDIDMNNIEEISILRGAAATALYGSRAAFGAIIIKTKRGTPGQRTRFTVTQRVQGETPILAGKQTSYTAGNYGLFCNALPSNQGGWCDPDYPSTYTSTTNNWGPHRDSIPQYVIDHENSAGRPIRLVDPRDDYYQTGVLSETSINANGGIPGGGSFNLGLTFTDQSGIQPNTSIRRLNLSTNIGLQLTERLMSNTMVMYSNTDNVWQNEGWQGREQDMMFVQPNLDIRKAWNEDGTPVMYGGNSPHWEWISENEFRGSLTTRWIGSQMLRYDIIPGRLSIQNQLGLDSYHTEQEQFQAERPWRTEQGLTSGAARQQRVTRTSLDDDLVLSLSGTPVGTGLTVSGLVGANLNMQEDNSLTGQGRDITIPGYYNVENFERQTVDEVLPQKRRLVGVYGQATVDYADWAFLTVTGRNDWSSTLPLDNNDYFYPSASLGVIFTDALGMQSSWLQYGKIRMSVAKVGSDAPRYRLATTYSGAGNVTWPYRGQLGYMQGNSLGNPDLKPESVREYEFGLDLRGLDGRARLDFSYYNKKSFDQIFSVPSSNATGFSSITRNAGDLQNKGIEISLQTVPIRAGDFRWDLRMNYSRNRSSVIDLAPGVESIYLAGYSWPQIRIMEGVPYGVIWGYGFAREHSDPNDPEYKPLPKDQGQILIGDDGLPVWDDRLKVIGSTEADWMGNLYSSFQYGPVALSGVLTTRQGGQILNFDLNYTVNRGIASVTEARNSPYVYKGLNVNTRQPNTVEIIRDRDYWQDEYGYYDHHEYQIEDGSFIRLQELTLSYQVPARLLGRFGVDNMTLFASGYNLWIDTDFSYGDPQGSNYGSTNAGGAAYRFFLPPSTRRYSIGARASF